MVDALIAAADGDAAGALAHAKLAVAQADKIGVTSERSVRSWPVAVRAARTLGDRDEVERLISVLGDRPVGHLPVVLHAELELARARRAGDDGEQTADASFSEAVAQLRRFASPYHLAMALLDHAEYLDRVGQPERAARAAVEAREIAETLGARPVAARAERSMPTTDPDADTSGERRPADSAWGTVVAPSSS